MKKKILLITLCIYGFQSFAQTDIVTSEWCARPKIVDGNIVEVRKPYNLYDSNSKIFFRIANDSGYIYLSFKISDKFEQMKVLKSGMVVGLSSKGTKKKTASISYPLADSNEDLALETQPRLTKQQDVKKLRDEVKLKKSLLELNGFTSENGLISVDPTSFIYVGIDYDKEAMYYDIIIPFTEFFGDKIISKDLSSILTLMVKVNAMKSHSSGENDRPRGMSEGEHGGGGMRRGGGMGHGGGSVGMRSERGMQGDQNGNMRFSSQEFKQKFILIVK